MMKPNPGVEDRSPAQSEGTVWHALEPNVVLARLEGAAEGLTVAEAERRATRYGPNALPVKPGRSAFRRFLDQCRNALIYVLVGASIVTAALGHWLDAGVIAAVVVINALIGFLQEGKAARALEAIQGMLSREAQVIRGGERRSIRASALVPGDIVLLESGDRVPADIRLIRSKGLRIQEAALTGESLPVDKNAAAVDAAVPLAERTCMAYSGTLAVAGQGRGVVIATGARTELGRISGMIADAPELTTPLLQRMNRFARVLTVSILIAATLVFAFGLLVRGYGVVDMFVAAVGIAVAGIPEGLPAIMTITLAIGVQRMATRNAIIRRLPTVETLGSVTVICTDKTGTLTRNEMFVREVVTADAAYRVSGEGYEPAGEFRRDELPPSAEELQRLTRIGRGALLCSDARIVEKGDAWHALGDPTEAALVAMAHKTGLEHGAELARRPRTDVIPFESEHRFMATLHHDAQGNGDGTIYVKGAPERLLGMCTHQIGQGGAAELDPDYWGAQMTRLAEAGYRVIALARREAPARMTTLNHEDLDDGLTLLALLGLEDPPREEAVEAIRRCRGAGVDIKMITGDHPVTARAIARQIGLGTDDVATGPELDGLSGDAFSRRALDADVFARASPENKLALVRALQARGHVVAMTGDGVNDAPALKTADVGVAMGRKGTEAAREAAGMVLADDNFASIANAMEEGRTVYDNLRKAILFLLPTSLAEGLVIVSAILAGQVLPITPLQILWVNMVTAVTLGLALGFERGDDDLMQRPPRPPSEGLLTPRLGARVVYVALVLLVGTFGLFLWETAHGSDLETARTMAVNTLVLFEAFYLLACRQLYLPTLNARSLRGFGPSALAILAVIGFQLALTEIAIFRVLFATTPLSIEDWARAAAVAATVVIVVELEKRALGRPKATAADLASKTTEEARR